MTHEHPRLLTEATSGDNRASLERRRRILHERLSFVRSQVTALESSHAMQAGSAWLNILEQSHSEQREQRFGILRDAVYAIIHGATSCTTPAPSPEAVFSLLAALAVVPGCSLQAAKPGTSETGCDHVDNDTHGMSTVAARHGTPAVSATTSGEGREGAGRSRLRGRFTRNAPSRLTIPSTPVPTEFTCSAAVGIPAVHSATATCTLASPGLHLHEQDPTPLPLSARSFASSKCSIESYSSC